MEAGMAKYFATEAAAKNADENMRIHGAYGYSCEFDAERIDRDAPLMIIGEGTNEMQRIIIARQLIERNPVYAGALLQGDQANLAAQLPHRLGRAVLGGVVEDEDLPLHPGRVGALDRGQAGEQVLAAVRVHDAVGEQRWQGGHDNRPP